MTEMQSTIGRIQLKRLDEWISIRNRNAMILREYLLNFKQIRVPLPNSNILHSYYKFYCYLDENRFLDGWNRKRFLNELNEMGFPGFTGSCSEIYLEKCFKNVAYEKREI